MKASALPILLLATSAQAINGRCDAKSSWGSRPDCICIDHNQCRNRWSGIAVQGSPGNWPCPHDAANVWGCMVGHPCVTADSYCGWRSVCTGTGPYSGTVLPNPVCPGGNDFVCCDMH